MQKEINCPMQSRIYQFLIAYGQGHGGAMPTIREVCQNASVSSTSMAFKYINRMTDSGLIEYFYPPHNRQKIMSITGSRWLPPSTDSVTSKLVIELGDSASGVYEFIIQYAKRYNGAMPTIREICRGVGFHSTSVPLYHLERLAGANLIQFLDVPIRKRKILTVVGSEWVAPDGENLPKAFCGYQIGDEVKVNLKSFFGEAFVAEVASVDDAGLTVVDEDGDEWECSWSEAKRIED